MEVRIKEEIFNRVDTISEYWLLDLKIPKNIDLSTYSIDEGIGIHRFTDIINYWTNDESKSEVNRKSVLRFIESIAELKDNFKTCNPESLYYEFRGFDIVELRVDISGIKYIDNIYEIDLKSISGMTTSENGLLYVTEKDDVEHIKNEFDEIYDEDDEIYDEDFITLDSSGGFPMFQTLEDENRMYDFIKSTVRKIKMLHYPDVD
ncbi:hypothetical protein N9515_09945 [Vicingaceae bacterium]|nr:hypothetical protein [Vicingaceae bacterium]